MKKKTRKKKTIQARFGDKLRALRHKRGWSQEDLADAVDLHRTYIGSVERGERNVSIVNIEKLAKSLDTSLREIFKEE